MARADKIGEGFGGGGGLIRRVVGGITGKGARSVNPVYQNTNQKITGAMKAMNKTSPKGKGAGKGGWNDSKMAYEMTKDIIDASKW